MPFTVGGEWISREEKKISRRPVKVRVEKRGRAIVTVVLHLPGEERELKEIASFLKRSLGGGGTVKKGTIEIQGEKQEMVRSLLLEKGIKAL